MKTILNIAQQHASIRLAGWLLIISAIAHVLQLLFLGTENPETMNGAYYGSSLAVVGLLLLKRPKIGLWLGVLWPGLLGTGAMYRIVMLNPTAMTYLFTLADIIVVIICLLHLVNKNETQNA